MVEAIDAEAPITKNPEEGVGVAFTDIALTQMANCGRSLTAPPLISPDKLVRPEGLEPSTNGLKVRCSTD